MAIQDPQAAPRTLLDSKARMILESVKFCLPLQQILIIKLLFCAEASLDPESRISPGQGEGRARRR